MDKPFFQKSNGYGEFVIRSMFAALREFFISLKQTSNFSTRLFYASIVKPGTQRGRHFPAKIRARFNQQHSFSVPRHLQRGQTSGKATVHNNEVEHCLNVRPVTLSGKGASIQRNCRNGGKKTSKEFTSFHGHSTPILLVQPPSLTVCLR